MTERRRKGEGSITLRSDGRYVARATDPATGRRISRYARTEAEARKALAEMTRRAAAGDPVADKRVTVQRYAEDWLANRAGRRRSEATLYQYEYRLKRHVYPHLGHIRLGALTIDQVEAWFDTLLDKGLAPLTVRDCRNTLSAVLTDAVRARAVATNVVRFAEMPRRAEAEREPRKAPPVGDARRLLEKASELDPEVGRLLLVIASTGARIGEAAAMREDDLDLDAGAWTVSRTITLDRQGREKVGTTTKGRASRVVRLPAVAVEALREQRRDVRKRQLAAEVWIDEAYVWPTSIGTPPNTSNLRKRIRAVAEAAGFEGSAHHLRHLFASLAAEVVEVAVVSRLLGHRHTSTTDTYLHLRPETGGEVAEAIGRALGGRDA